MVTRVATGEVARVEAVAIAAEGWGVTRAAGKAPSQAGMVAAWAAVARAPGATAVVGRAAAREAAEKAAAREAGG